MQIGKYIMKGLTLKGIILIHVVLLLLRTILYAVETDEKALFAFTEKEVEKQYPIYTDHNADDNNFIPSEWRGDYDDLKLNDKYNKNVHNGVSCMQWRYFPKLSQKAGWAGCYWRYSAKKQGIEKRLGVDLSWANKLVFWARGEKGTEKIVEFGVGGLGNKYINNNKACLHKIILDKKWKKYEIDLSGMDLTNVIEGFYWLTTYDSLSDEGITFYLDDIKFE